MLFCWVLVWGGVCGEVGLIFGWCLLLIGICRQKYRITNNFSDLPTKINHLPTILQKSTNFTRSLLHGNAACQMTNCRRDGQTFFIRFNDRNLNISPISSSFRPIFKYIVQINLISTKSTRYRRFFKNRQISPPPPLCHSPIPYWSWRMVFCAPNLHPQIPSPSQYKKATPQPRGMATPPQYQTSLQYPVPRSIPYFLIRYCRF